MESLWRAAFIEIGLWLFFPLLFLLYLGYFLVKLWRLKRREKEGPPHGDARQ